MFSGRASKCFVIFSMASCLSSLFRHPWFPSMADANVGTEWYFFSSKVYTHLYPLPVDLGTRDRWVEFSLPMNVLLRRARIVYEEEWRREFGALCRSVLMML